MTIRLTCTLPASADDLATFLGIVRQLDIDSINHDLTDPTDAGSLVLVADLGAPPAAIEVVPEPEPAPVKRPAKKATAKKAAPRKAGPLAGKILDALDDMGGTWNGTASDLARHLGLNPRSGGSAILSLAKAGKVTLTKANPTTVTAIALGGKAPVQPAREATVSELPARTPAAPVPVPAGGLQPPTGGWA